MNPDSLIDELLAATDLKHAVDDAAESESIYYTIHVSLMKIQVEDLK